MEINLKITQVLNPQEGVSKDGNPWKVQGYVGETQGDYPKKVYFEVFGEERIEENQCEVDEMVTVSFDIESREYNGRWYTTIRAWKVEKAPLAAEPVPSAPEKQSEDDEDLPF